MAERLRAENVNLAGGRLEQGLRRFLVRTVNEFDSVEAFADAMVRIEQGFRSLLKRPDWSTALLVAHEGVNRLALAWVLGAPLGACAGFGQDTGCINIIDFDLGPDDTGERTRIERAVIKAVNLTPANYLKNGMNLRSLEAIFTRAAP